MPVDRTSTARLLQQLESGEVTAVDLAKQMLARIDESDADIHAFLHVDNDGALATAADVDRRRAAGESLGLLAGIPVAVKDAICVRDQPTTCASRMLESYNPPYDAHIVQQLRRADAVLIGKTNLDEFCMGSSTETSAFGGTCNPADVTRSPGGSSGGSAAAVAANFTPLAIGSDTGGSIRQPAAFCGVVGLKPTYGRVSRYGLVAYASSLDQIGPLAGDVTGAARLLQVIAGHDERDSTSVNAAVPDFLTDLDQPLQDLKIGVVREYFSDGLDPAISDAVKQALDVYQSLGAQLVDVSLPHQKYAVATYYLIACSEASSNLARYDGVHYGRRAEQYDDMIDMYCRSRGEAFGAEVKRRIMLGTYALSAGYADQYYHQALKARRLIREDFDKAFSQVDVIAGPTMPVTAFKLGEMLSDPLAMYLSDVYTISANLAGLPGISLPCGTTTAADTGCELPIGLQLQSPPMSEDRLLRIARMYEAATERLQG